MKLGGGHAKGSAFERSICKKLSLWWTGNHAEPRDDVFWRTAGSGARATSRSKKGKQTAGAYGDITFIDPIGKPLLDILCFELKAGYGSYCALDVVDKKPSKKDATLVSFWKQAKESSAQMPNNTVIKNYPAVIFKRNQKEACIMLSKRFISMLRAENDMHDHFMYMWIDEEWVGIIPLDYLLQVVAPLFFINKARKRGLLNGN